MIDYFKIYEYDLSIIKSYKTLLDNNLVIYYFYISFKIL
jgi:hypothetical protein